MAASGPVSIPFPFTIAPGAKVQEGRGKIINGYWEPLGDPSAPHRICRRAPGLKNFGTTEEEGYRGSIEIGGTFYSAFDGRLIKHTSAGGAGTVVGNLNGSRKGFFARNNASPPDQMFVDIDANIATFTASSVTNSSPDPDLPSVTGLTVINNYFVCTAGDGRAFASGLGDTTFDPLSFGRADAKPDGLVRPINFAGRLLLFGNYSLEVWSDVGATPFPFQRSQVVPRGLAGPYAVAGQEDGFGRELLFVGDDNGVYRTADGYQIEKVSPPDLDALIEAVEDKTLLEASVYISRGHAFWQLSTPTWTWVIDLNTQTWTQRDSYGQARSRIIGGTYAFGKWLCGDALSGNIQEISSAMQTELGSPLRWRIESGPADKFPNSSFVGRADFRFITGVGEAEGLDPVQTNPKAEVSFSDDGGFTWTPPAVKPLGRQSRTNAVSVVPAGRTTQYGRRWRLDISDPVHVGFSSGTMSEDPRAF